MFQRHLYHPSSLCKAHCRRGGGKIICRGTVFARHDCDAAAQQWGQCPQHLHGIKPAKIPVWMGKRLISPTPGRGAIGNQWLPREEMPVSFRDEAAEAYPCFCTLCILYTVALNGFSGFKNKQTKATSSWRESGGGETKELGGEELGMDLITAHFLHVWNSQTKYFPELA